jgi:hypothetical protein
MTVLALKLVAYGSLVAMFGLFVVMMRAIWRGVERERAVERAWKEWRERR